MAFWECYAPGFSRAEDVSQKEKVTAVRQRMERGAGLSSAPESQKVRIGCKSKKELSMEQNNTPRPKGGLYAKIKMSVKTANILVAVLAVVLIGALVFVTLHNGFTVSFDTGGGTAVESVRVLHGETLPEQDAPTREGYVFTGWYTDRACTTAWNAEDAITGSMTLYAGWETK